MKTSLPALAALALLCPVAAASAETVREARPNALGVELLGAAGLVSVSGEVQLAPWLGLTLGLAPWARIGDDTFRLTPAIPVGLVFHPTSGTHGLVFTAVALVTPARITASEHGDTFTDSFVPRAALGGGYQLQTAGGFLLRAQLYAAATRALTWSPIGAPERPARWDFGPWAGVFLGYAF